MALCGSRAGPRLRGTVVGMLLLAAGGALATRGFAAPSAVCLGEPATITGSGIIAGTEGDDVIVGSAVSDAIDGKGGDDLVCGLGGNDVGLNGGLGDDRLEGGAGSDRLRGDVGFPRGSGRAAVGGDDDVLYGGPGDDRLVGDSSSDFASGGGRDRLFGGHGDDDMTGDTVAFVGRARGGGDDVLDGGPGVEFLVGDSEAFEGDAIGDGGDVLDLGADGGSIAIGDHNISEVPPRGGSARGAGDDLIIGGSADDILLGDSSTAGPPGDAGDDELNGGGGNDSVFGDNATFSVTETFGSVGGEDRLAGGTGDDTLRAGPGDDGLDGGPNTDDCDGEAGADTLSSCEASPTPTNGPGAARGRRLIAPPDRTIVRTGRPPLLRWTAVRGARYYNLQLFRNRRKVLSAWPSQPRYRLKPRWRYRGERHRLAPGRYHWLVWPGFGPRSRADYGKRMGPSTFDVRPARSLGAAPADSDPSRLVKRPGIPRWVGVPMRGGDRRRSARGGDR
jgi:Ca2+-binding RTX toxin-like protein